MARKFSELVQSQLGDFKHPLITELLGKSFVIRGATENVSAKGNYAVISCEVDGVLKDYRTSSTVLLDQLRMMQNSGALDEGYEVTLTEAKSATGRSYLTFE